MQNCLARVVTQSCCFPHSVPLLRSLHSRSAQSPVKYFHPSNQHIHIYCSLLPRQLRSSNSNRFVPTVKTNVRTRAVSVAAPTLWNSLPVSVKSVGNIATFCHQLKTTCLNLLILHSSPAYQSNCLVLELLIDYELLNSFCFGALPSLRFPRI